jgi:hypothetical protein
VASQRIACGETNMSMNTFVESQLIPGLVRDGCKLHIPCDFFDEYSWAEQKYKAGDYTALVSRYDCIPIDLKYSLDDLVAAGYRKNLFLSNFFEASLLLLSSGIFPSLKSLVEPSKEVYAGYCSVDECVRASEFVSTRNADDIVVLVLNSGTLIGSMTLYPFSNKSDMPSLSYLNLSTAEKLLPNVPALEVGRLAKSPLIDDQNTRSSAGLLQTVWIAAAFIVARDFVINNGLLEHPASYVCGDTYGSLIAGLRHFFPIEIVPSTIRTDILDKNSDARDVAIYFLQRQILGSFESSDDFMKSISEIRHYNPKIAYRIIELMEMGLKKMGISSLQNFDAKKFKIDFFYFLYGDEQTKKGLNRLEKVIRKLTSNSIASVH